MVTTEPGIRAPLLLARRWPRRGDRTGPDLSDAAIAAGCWLALTVPVLLGGGPARTLAVEALAGFLAAAPLLVRRRWPVAVTLATAAVYVAAAVAGVAFTPFISNAGPSLAIAVFTAADRSSRRASLSAACVAGAATWASLPVAIRLHPQHDQDAVQLVAVAAAWLAGDMVRAIRGYRQQLQLVQRQRAAEEVQLARAEERLRVTRDVHDVVSHSLSAIAVQAGVARLVSAGQAGSEGQAGSAGSAEAALSALSAIETASRSALDELRTLLRQIRDPRDDDIAAPALSDLPGLVSRLSQAGLDVSFSGTGERRSYRAAVESSAYRIAQEALTNVSRHASGAHAELRIDHGPDGVTLTVSDDGTRHGPGAPAPGSGLGIPGMRDRAALLGGTLTAGPAPDGGFVVVAWLPAREAGSDR